MQNHNLAGETFVELAAVAVVSSARISKVAGARSGSIPSSSSVVD